jgi:UDPglucose 6-dehydrogenase
MQIAIVGTGYVGLVTGACFAQFGHGVTCVDRDVAKVERLLAGQMPIYEPNLETLVGDNVRAGRLQFATSLAPVMGEADAVFIAVGTPSRRGDGHADLTYVEQVAAEIARTLRHYTVVVTKSTVPVGTGQRVEEIIRRLRPDAEFDVVSNPEFLREGSAIEDFMRPDRVLIGAETEQAREIMRGVYRPLFLNETPVLFMNRESAELAKYAANAFLATKITFINEVADLCERVGADVQQVAKGMGLDGRIGRKFLHAGPGYGGSCFPKDTRALIQTALDAEVQLRVVSEVVEVNEARKRAMADRVVAAAGGSLVGATVAVLGVSFKPNTDDMREAASLDVIPALQQAGARVQAYDPAAMREAAQMLDDVQWCEGAYEAVEGADVLLILTEWNEFRALDLLRVRSLMRAPTVVDLRNIYPRDEMEAADFAYYSIGRAPVHRSGVRAPEGAYPPAGGGAPHPSAESGTRPPS